jgi:hypothetical protein
MWIGSKKKRKKRQVLGWFKIGKRKWIGSKNNPPNKDKYWVGSK